MLGSPLSDWQAPGRERSEVTARPAARATGFPLAAAAATAAAAAITAAPASASIGLAASAPATAAPAPAPPFIAEFSHACASVPPPRGALADARPNNVARAGPRHSPA